MQLRACTPSSVAVLRKRRSRSQGGSPSRHTGRCAWLRMTCMSASRCIAVDGTIAAVKTWCLGVQRSFPACMKCTLSLETVCDDMLP